MPDLDEMQRQFAEQRAADLLQRKRDVAPRLFDLAKRLVAGMQHSAIATDDATNAYVEIEALVAAVEGDKDHA